MKKMKTKRFLSLLLALVMSLALAAPAFAAEPGDGDGDDEGGGGIMPRMHLFEDPFVNIRDAYRTDSFTSTPRNGRYIKVWYRNNSDQNAYVYLYRENSVNPVAQMLVRPNSEPGVIWYAGSDTVAITYYVRIKAELGGQVTGYLAVAQKPNMAS